MKCCVYYCALAMGLGLANLFVASGQQPPATSSANSLPLEVTGECFALFSTKVQLILANTCANCHATGKGGKFVLVRPGDASTRQTVQLNLTESIKQICFEQPAASPLLHNACSAHGSSAIPPLPSRQSVPYLTLQQWVQMVATQNPQLKKHGAAAIASEISLLNARNATHMDITQTKSVNEVNPPIARLIPAENSLGTTTGMLPEARVVPTNLSQLGPSATPRFLPAQETTSAISLSPYDATPFNRMWHPKR